MKNYYKFKFYINAKHSVNFNENVSPIHPHTWETVIYLKVKETAFINFTKFEKTLERYFDAYEGQYLNDLEVFKGENPTMERIGRVFYHDLLALLKGEELSLCKIEISENPTRTYIIEEEN